MLAAITDQTSTWMDASGPKWSSIRTSYDPQVQVDQTIPLIQEYVARDFASPLIKDAASRYAQAMLGASKQEIAWQAAKDHLRFTNDQVVASDAGITSEDDVIEVLRRPWDVAYEYQLTGMPVAGDCDDFSMFVAAMALALDPSSDVRFVCVAANPAEPGVLSHIYTMIDGVAVDASHGPYAGWEVPATAITRRVEYGLSALWWPAALLIGAVLIYMLRGLRPLGAY